MTCQYGRQSPPFRFRSIARTLLDYAIVFALGFLIAGLLGFAMLPIVWRRAMRLTRRQLETGIPISMAEVRARLDHTRAEAAIELRRVEAKAEAERDRRHAIMAENGRLTETIRRLSAETDARLASIRAAEEGQLGTEATLADVQQAMLGVKAELVTTKATLVMRDQTIAVLRRDIEGATMEIDGQRVELVALRTKLATAQDELSQARREVGDLTQVGVERDSQLAVHSSSLDQKSLVLADARRRAEMAEERVRGLEVQLAERSAEAAAVDGDRNEIEARFVSLASELHEKSAALRDAEVRLAAMAEREARLASEIAQLRGEGAEADQEHLRAEVAALKREARERWLAIEDDNRKLRVAMARLSAEIAGQGARRPAALEGATRLALPRATPAGTPA